METKKLLYLVFAVFISTSAIAQNIEKDKIPATVLNAFKSKFPAADNVKWEMENARDYEATFKTNGNEQSAVFDANGAWLETETEIKENELPANVKASFAKEFNSYKIKETEKVEKNDGTTCYEIKLTNGKETIEVLFADNGEVKEKKSESSDKDKDKDDKD